MLIETITCFTCSQRIPTSDFYQHKDNTLFHECISCNKARSQRFQELFKAECVAYKGNLCVDCLEVVPLAAFSFHHLDPTQKDFCVSGRRTKGLTATTKAELDKCVLLCRNCHAIRHAILWQSW